MAFYLCCICSLYLQLKYFFQSKNGTRCFVWYEDSPILLSVFKCMTVASLETFVWNNIHMYWVIRKAIKISPSVIMVNCTVSACVRGISLYVIFFPLIFFGTRQKLAGTVLLTRQSKYNDVCAMTLSLPKYCTFFLVMIWDEYTIVGNRPG